MNNSSPNVLGLSNEIMISVAVTHSCRNNIASIIQKRNSQNLSTTNEIYFEYIQVLSRWLTWFLD